MPGSFSSPLRTYLLISGSPWLRWAARLVDIYLFSILILTVVPLPADQDWRRAMQVGVVMLWVPFEAILLEFTASTPGKWLFGLSVRHSDGARLTFMQALNRTSLVFVYGLGFGFLAPFAMP